MKNDNLTNMLSEAVRQTWSKRTIFPFEDLKYNMKLFVTYKDLNFKFKSLKHRT